MKRKSILIACLSLGFSFFSCVFGSDSIVSAHNPSNSYDDATAIGHHKSSNESINMCELCDRNKEKFKNMKKCYHGGDYIDFHYHFWVVSIVTPKSPSEECYFDIFPPKARFDNGSVNNMVERLYVTRNCSGGCRSVYNRFNLQNQYQNIYSYEIHQQNDAGIKIFIKMCPVI